MTFNCNTVEVVGCNCATCVTNGMLTINSFHLIGVCAADLFAITHELHYCFILRMIAVRKHCW